MKVGNVLKHKIHDVFIVVLEIDCYNPSSFCNCDDCIDTGTKVEVLFNFVDPKLNKKVFIMDFPLDDYKHSSYQEACECYKRNTKKTEDNAIAKDIIQMIIRKSLIIADNLNLALSKDELMEIYEIIGKDYLVNLLIETKKDK